MKITNHGDAVYKLTRLGLINCYLLVDGDELSLIDANLSGSADAILKAAAEIGKPAFFSPLLKPLPAQNKSSQEKDSHLHI